MTDDALSGPDDVGTRRLVGRAGWVAPRTITTPSGMTGDASVDAGGGVAADSADPTNLRRATAGMAAGTAVSRITGLLRVIALAYALGFHHLADAYNLANTTPNMLYDIVLGGVLSATFIPVFVDRLATRSDREAWRAISSIVTLSVVVLAVMTVLFWLLSPEIISAFTALGSTSAAHATTLASERSVATTLLRWFVPQIALYGLLALAEALLNSKRRFAAPMWVPIANNLVCIGVLLWFHALVPHFPTLRGVQVNSGELLLLGLGTTLGVALQAGLLLPALRGIGLARLRWRWDPRHEAVRTVVRLGSWTFGFVVANQVALFVVLTLAVGAPGTDPVSSYTYAYTFMQLPFAVVAVSIMSAVTPELSERWATGDLAAFRRRLAAGLRATLAAILPAAVGMFLLAKPAVALLLGHGSTTVTGTQVTGSSLALFSLGLPGFCAFLYVIRVLQSMQRPKVAFWLYLVENGLNVALAAALVHPLGVRGLALSLSIAYSVAAVIGLVVLHRWLGTLGGTRTWGPLRRVGLATAVMGAVVLVVSNISGAQQGIGLLVRVAGSVVVGGAVYAAAATLLGGRRRGFSPFPEPTDDDRGGWPATRPSGGRAGGVVHGAETPPRARHEDPRVHITGARVTGGRARVTVPGADAPGAGARSGGRRRGAPTAPRPRVPVDPPPAGQPAIPPPPHHDVAPAHGSPSPQVPGESAAASPRGGAGGHVRIVPDPGRARRGRRPQEPVDADDLLGTNDVGDVRWIGGTPTGLRGRPPR